MTKFDVLVLFTTDTVDQFGEVIETVEADNEEDAKKLAEELNDVSDKWDVEAYAVWVNND